MTISLRIEKLAQKISTNCRAIDPKSVDAFLDSIVSANRIFVAGAGRSGLAVKAFGMRLMHLGFTVFVVGEVITPAIRKGDLLIVVSGSGKTTSMLNIITASKSKNANVVAITSYTDSPIALASDHIVQIKGRILDDLAPDYGPRQILGGHEAMTPLGTLFELSAMLFFDASIEELMLRYKKSEEEMKEYHTNLE